MQLKRLPFTAAYDVIIFTRSFIHNWCNMYLLDDELAVIRDFCRMKDEEIRRLNLRLKWSLEQMGISYEGREHRTTRDTDSSDALQLHVDEKQ
jgi:hypothetical protein